MSSSNSGGDNPSSYSAMDKIDLICDQFETELRRGFAPRIEDFLKQVDEQWRMRLLHDLLAIDIEFSPLELELALNRYRQRFPDATEVLDKLKKEFKINPRRTQATPQHSQTDPTVDARLPSQIGRFKLIEIAGMGGFGTVWRAMDLQLQREVAVKIPRIEHTSKTQLSTLIREARFAARLRHPNIVTVYEVGEEQGTTYIVTDFINGKNLKEWKKDRQISPVDAARLVAKMAVAIEHAHQQGVIHRDLKLANVMMDSEGNPHITDFGLAKREARDDSLAVEGQLMGTPAYMSPEQARADHGNTDRRTDIYALGVILYELITGSTPYRGDVPELLYQILSVPPVAPRSINTAIPGDLEAICLKCLAKEASKRYGTAQALADDLYLFLNGETLVGIPVPLTKRVWKWFQRHRRYVATLTTVATIFAFLSAGLMALRNQSIKPTSASIPVRIVTEPPGCEITAVAINPETGEPDPQNIKTARGRTPLTMSLPSGDYLIVAVLDAHRFHEVLRHVPERNEGTPFRYTHLFWRKSKSGEIELKEIKIPRPDISLGMAFCESSDQLVESIAKSKTQNEVQPAKVSWRIPSFYVDRSEMKLSDSEGLLRDRLISDSIRGDGVYYVTNYFNAVELAELLGKRLPNAAEMAYVSHFICPEKEGKDLPCPLPDGTFLEGIHSGAREWTTTLPGGPFSGCDRMPVMLGLNSHETPRMASCAERMNLEKPGESSTNTGLWVTRVLDSHGFRFARSINPRRTAADFMSVSQKKVD